MAAETALSAPSRRSCRRLKHNGCVRAIARVRLPTAPPQVKHIVGAPLTFKVSVNGKRALSPGVVTLLGGSSSKVAKEVATAAAS